jgi:pyridoxamine 5'-phosphate oxidase
MTTLHSCTEPYGLFSLWLEEAKAHPQIAEPTAMSLATVADNVPSVRIVLLKDVSEQGFVFYTNLESRKSNEIHATHSAALCFYWMPLDKQVRVVGRAEAMEDALADAYFAGRPRERQIGAWASAQSRPMASREDLDANIALITARFEGQPIPRPPHWSGWRVIPHEIELWEQRPHRWHERCVFTRDPQGGWVKTWLYP